MRCPNCGVRNILGADLCENCGSDLAGLDLPEADEGFRGRLMTDGLGDIPLEPPLSVPPEATAAEAIRRMREARRGCALIQDGDRLAGIFTERDVLTRVLRRDLDPESLPVTAVMTPDPITLGPSDPPAFAVHRMVAQGLRHVPILSRGELVGLVSVRGVLQYVADLILPAQQ